MGKEERDTPQRPDKPLTIKQRAFVEALVADPKGDIKVAAVSAGFSPVSAKQIANDLLHAKKYGHVSAEYRRLSRERLAQYGIDAQEWMDRAAAVLKVDRRKIFKWDGNNLTVNPTENMRPEEVALIQEISVVVGDDGEARPRIKLAPLAPFYQMVGKALGLFRERIEIDATIEYAAAEESLTRKLAELRQSLERAILGEPKPPGEEGSPL